MNEVNLTSNCLQCSHSIPADRFCLISWQSQNVDHVALLRNGLLCFSSYFESVVAVQCPSLKTSSVEWCRNIIISNILLENLKMVFSCSPPSNAESSNTQNTPSDQNVLTEQWIRSAWSVRPALFWEPAFSVYTVKAYRGSRSITPRILKLGAKTEVGDQIHATAIKLGKPHSGPLCF